MIGLDATILSAEKRQHERHAAVLAVSFELAGEHVEVRTRDISLGGMFLTTERSIPYGTAMKFSIALPHLTEPAVVDGVVRWVDPEGIGVQFGTLRVRETWALNQLLKR